jgi:hypothetical protein
MRSQALAILALSFSPPASVAYEPKWPRFSWDTVPVFYHSCNFTGPYTDAALQIVAKFPFVVREQRVACPLSCSWFFLAAVPTTLGALYRTDD